MKFEWGMRGSLFERRESLRLGLGQPLRLWYASDLHLRAGNATRLLGPLVDSARRCRPAAILLGGDLVDVRGGLAPLGALVRALAELAPLFAIAGNHDAWVGRRRVEEAVTEAGGRWLGAEPVDLEGGVQLLGPAAVASRERGPASSPRDRPTARPPPDETWTTHRILVAHDPAVFPRARRAGIRLTLAGHLHGGQVVLFERKGRLYPGACFYRWNGLRFEDGGATMWVSRGVADTLPLRWNCPREVLVCELS